MDQERRLPPQAGPALPAGDSPQAAISLSRGTAWDPHSTHRPDVPLAADEDARYRRAGCPARVSVWALQTSRGSTDEVYQARRLDVVRIFARHLQALDPATELPPDDVLSRRYRRIPPYLYSPEQITALMSAADSLRRAPR
jgi:hypothetical protein